MMMNRKWATLSKRSLSSNRNRGNIPGRSDFRPSDLRPIFFPPVCPRLAAGILSRIPKSKLDHPSPDGIDRAPIMGAPPTLSGRPV